MKANPISYDRGLVLQIGLILSLSVVLFAFRWHQVLPESIIKDPGEEPIELIDFEASIVLHRLPQPPHLQEKTEATAALTPSTTDLVSDWPETPLFTSVLPTIPDEFIDSVEVYVPGDEVFPRFPGGNEALMRYLSNNLRYNSTAIEFGISGRVFISFVVQADGSISEVRILKGLGYGLDEEAIRVVKSMPRWIPGTQNGRPVAVAYNLPIQFSLRKN